MIQLHYEVFCDECGELIDDYLHFKPSLEKLRTDGIKIFKGYHFCSAYCFQKWYRDNTPKS